VNYSTSVKMTDSVCNLFAHVHFLLEREDVAVAQDLQNRLVGKILHHDKVVEHDGEKPKVSADVGVSAGLEKQVSFGKVHFEVLNLLYCHRRMIKRRSEDLSKSTSTNAMVFMDVNVF